MWLLRVILKIGKELHFLEFYVRENRIRYITNAKKNPLLGYEWCAGITFLSAGTQLQIPGVLNDGSEITADSCSQACVCGEVEQPWAAHCSTQRSVSSVQSSVLWSSTTLSCLLHLWDQEEWSSQMVFSLPGFVGQKASLCAAHFPVVVLTSCIN